MQKELPWPAEAAGAFCAQMRPLAALTMVQWVQPHPHTDTDTDTHTHTQTDTGTHTDTDTDT